MSEAYCAPGEAYELLHDFMEYLTVSHIEARRRCAAGTGNVGYHAGYVQALQDAMHWWRE